MGGVGGEGVRGGGGGGVELFFYISIFLLEKKHITAGLASKLSQCQIIFLGCYKHITIIEIKTINTKTHVQKEKKNVRNENLIVET